MGSGLWTSDSFHTSTISLGVPTAMTPGTPQVHTTGQWYGRSTLPGTGCLLDVAVAGKGYYRLEKISYAFFFFFSLVILGVSPQLDSFWAKETRSLSTSTQHAECKTDSDLRTLEVIRTGLKELKVPVKKVYMTHLHLIGTSALSRSPGWAGLWYNSDGPSIHMCKATYKALYI